MSGTVINISPAGKMPPVKVINETEETIIPKEGIIALYKRVAEIPRGGNHVEDRSKCNIPRIPVR